ALIEETDCSNADVFVLPGGMPGTRNLQAHSLLNEELRKANEAGKLLCAICAAPLVLGANHILEGKNACCYPSFEEELLGAITNENPVTHDGNTITSRGLGTAINFAAEIIATLLGKGQTSLAVGRLMVWNVMVTLSFTRIPSVVAERYPSACIFGISPSGTSI
ncbi:MAG: DJ-1/PfpI family protein, partial [Clostridiales bacterium]|nr:DJ-1/PfpI family protein [Clostridiales bacterium]